jgi:hypothetical protein
MLGLSPSRVYEYVEDGGLSLVRNARIILILLEEVKNFKPKLLGVRAKAFYGGAFLPKITSYAQLLLL